VTIFDDIYRGNLWNGDESRSGPGSGSAATRSVRDAIVALVAELGVETVLDVGCGDGYWMPALPGYVGYDASRVAVRLARANHPDRAYTTVLPWHAFDLVICRDVIQHLPLQDGLDLLDAIEGTRSTYLLASTYVGGVNVDIPAGGCYSPDLTAEPFGFKPPERLIFDGHHYHEHGTDAVRDPSKHLGLWRL
jgi:SAM-dependent methyltransferase